MNHENISDWYNSLKQELKGNSLSIEKVSRRSEYWRKSNLDIVSDLVQDTSKIEPSSLKGVSLYEPDLTIYGDSVELKTDKSYRVSSIMDIIADEESYAKNYFGNLNKNPKNVFQGLWLGKIVLVLKLVML